MLNQYPRLQLALTDLVSGLANCTKTSKERDESSSEGELP